MADPIIISSPPGIDAAGSSTEVVDARTSVTQTFNNLKARLDNNDATVALKANQLDLIIERTRIDNLAILPEGSTSGDAELIDSRIDFAGEVHSSSGDNIRKIHEKLLSIAGGFRNMYDGTHTAAGHPLDGTTGLEIIATQTGCATYFIACTPQTQYIMDYILNVIGYASGIFFYDIGQIFLNRINSATTFTTPANCYYFRLGGNTTYVDGKDIQVNKGTVLLPFDGYSPFIRQNIFDVLFTKAIAGLAGNVIVYYVSVTGNDANSGLSVDKPKKTLASVNNLTNCTILFKSGEEFVMTDPTMQALICRSNVTIGSYGGITRPIINGYFTLNLTWSSAGINIYEASLVDQGFYTGVGQAYDLVNIGHLLVDDVYNGKRVQTLVTLVNEGEYFCDEVNCKLYYYTTGTPVGKVFKSARNGHGIKIFTYDNCKVHGIEVKGFGRHGIWVQDADNCEVTDNEIHHIGGCKISATGVRYGNGFEQYASGVGLLVDRNYIHDCFDAGVTNQTDTAIIQKNFFYRRNVVERCWYLMEVFDRRDTAISDMKNVIYEDNTFIDSLDITGGYRFNAGQTSGACMRLYCGTPNQLIIRNNVCYNSQCYMIYSTDEAGHAGITFSGNTYIQKTGGNVFYPGAHVLGTGETSIMVALSPSTADEYGVKGYALALVAKKVAMIK